MSSDGGVSTGTPINVVGPSPKARDKCEPVVEPCVMFDEQSESTYSPTIIIPQDANSTKIVRLYEAEPGVIVQLMMLAGKDNQYKTQVRGPDGVGVQMQASGVNVAVLTSPGRYRLEHTGEPGDVVAMCEDVPCCFFPLVSRYTG